MRKTHAIETWLIDGARTAASPQDVLLQMCEKLVACGVPLGRAAVFVKTIHPMVMGQSFTWKPGEGVRIGQRPVGFEASDTSPDIFFQTKCSASFVNHMFFPPPVTL